MAGKRSKLGLAVAATLVTLLVLEIALRVVVHVNDEQRFAAAMSRAPDLLAGAEVDLADILRPSASARRVYELRPDLSASFLGHPLTTSSAGFRDRDYPRKKPDGVRRIVGLGDSFMFGWGVAPGEDYLSVLEELLNVDGRWEVINTAVPGYNTAMEVETLRLHGLAYAPDVVVVGLVSNDAALPNFLNGERDVFDAGRSFLFDAAFGETMATDSDLLVDAPLPAGANPREQAFEFDAARVPERYRDMVGWEGLERALQELSAMRDEQGFDVVVVYVAPFQDRLVADTLRRCEELGFAVVDAGATLARIMADEGIEVWLGSTLSVSATDPHPSARAHRITAEELHRHLAR